MLLLTLALLAATPAPREVSAVIWGGGATEADAALALDQWNSRTTTWGELFKLADGYPKLVPSDTWPQLNKGLFVVVLGLCDKPSPAVEAIDALEPNLYEKRVVTAEPTACPRFEFDDESDPGDEGLRLHLAPDGVQLDGPFRVVVLTGSYSQQGDFASEMSGIIIVASRRKGSALLEEKVTVLGGKYESFARLEHVRRDGKKVLLDWSGASPSCAQMNDDAVIFDATTTVTPSLALTTKKRNQKQQHCGWEAEKAIYEQHP